MKKARCKKCKKRLTDDMDIQYMNEYCEFFCSKECVSNYLMKEFGVFKVDLTNIRKVCDIAFIKNGQIYYSNLDDDWCKKCDEGNLRFFEMTIENNIEFEIYKCNQCGNKVKIKCY